MISRCALLSIICILCTAPCGVQAQKKDEPKDFDRITPIVRVVQKCQGAVVVFLNPETGKPLGTGVIVHESGLIVTNVHVVGSKDTMPVQLLDKTEYKGKVLARKAAYDLAVVKINPTGKLDAMPPTTSDKVYVGEDVIAIGHPYGYSYSISRGILSATGRTIPLPSGDDVKDVYQVDAAINPGNSGGPLMNINGDFIAVNFAMRQGAELIGFSIPAKKVREVLADFLK